MGWVFTLGLLVGLIAGSIVGPGMSELYADAYLYMHDDQAGYSAERSSEFN